MTVPPIPDDELVWRFSRASGPGGQSVNTTDSRVELRWDLAGSPALDAVQRARATERLAGRLIGGVLVVVAAEHRSQLRNRQAARERMEALFADSLRPVRRRHPTRPTAGSRRRRSESKRRRSETKRLRRPPE